MKCPITPKPPNPGNTAITLLRAVLWFLPAIMLPVSFLLTGLVDASWPIGFILFFGITATIGYFDLRLIYHRDRRDPRPDRVRIICWAIAFMLIQIIIVPGVLLLIAITTEYFSTTIFKKPPFWHP